LFVDDGSVVLIEEVQGAGVFAWAYRGLASPGPSGIMREYFVCVQLSFIDGESEELTRPAIWLAWGIAGN
jgi:hypothetical protein